MADDDSSTDPAAPVVATRWARAPGWVFNLLVAVLGLAWLSALSTMVDTLVLLLALSSVALLLLAVVWLVRLVAYGVARRGGTDAAPFRGFLVAPILGLVMLGLAIGMAPLQARWSLSRPAFEDTVDEVLAGADGQLDESERIGLYEVARIERHGDAIVFYERSDDPTILGGFAYLPEGSTGELALDFERYATGYLGGGWYAWAADG